MARIIDMGQALETLRKSRVRVVGKKYSPDRLRKFLDILADKGVLAWAASGAGFCTTSAKYYIQKSLDGDPAFVITWRNVEGPFHELVQAALDESVDDIEGHAIKRAKGYEEVLTHQGRVIYQYDPDLLAIGLTGPDAYLRDSKNRPIPETVTKQSEDLQMFILKARRPDIYGNKSQVELTHKGGVMVVTAPLRTSADLEKRAKQISEEPVDVEFIEIEDAEDEPNG